MSKVFKTIKKIDGKEDSGHSSTPLLYHGRMLKTDAAKADAFAKEYISSRLQDRHPA
jgi:hypothetical protein